MTKEQLEALKEYIVATIKVEIEEAFGRDPLLESIAQREAERALNKAITEDEYP